MKPRLAHLLSITLVAVLYAASLSAQTAPKITAPKAALGFNIGDDYQVVSYSQLESCWKKLAAESNRMKLVDIGPTAEGRRQYMAIITSPENQKNLERYKEISRRLAEADGLTDEQARALAREGKAVVWIDGGLHASETVGSQQLMEMVFQMVSRTDAETMRFLNDVILLCVPANPDGQELVANWYMREKEPAKRSMSGLPRLYAKYAGHDNNRDFYMSTMPETTNMNRQLFLEWFPQIMYDHHQSGPAGTVIFIPPFRDPFNYNFDPLIPLGVELVSTAMHSRLVAEGKGGSVMRTGATYSTWWNGGLRSITYFHNMIGILTEIIGSPTPMTIPLVADKQLATGDWPLPIAPQEWHYRQSIDYSISLNRAILDMASRYRETFLYNIYQMGRNSIEKGSKDSWTVTPKRIEALQAAAKASPQGADRGPAAGATAGAAAGATPGAAAGATAGAAAGATPGAAAGATAGAAAGGDAPAGPGALALPSALYENVLHDPVRRDPRGYIIPANQADFATATEFVNALLKTGIKVLRATSDFQVAGKNYPAGSYVVKTAQAFRPHIMDMFEPQDHPSDFRYPGGPPNPPYDIAGWTLALQMGIEFDRILDAFDGPLGKVTGLLPPPPASVNGPANSAGYLISHQINNSFILANRLLKAGCDVYWLKAAPQTGGHDLGTGAIWAPASISSRPLIESAAKQLGVPAQVLAQAPAGGAMKLKPIRVGLVDQYGGSMTSGWTRWLFEQYEVPFEVVYPQALDAGNLNAKFDVLVLTDGIFRVGGIPQRREPDPASIPEEYRGWLGRITAEKTMPEIKRFVEAGGSLVAIGSSTSTWELFGLPLKNHLTEKDSEGKDRVLPRDKFYVPGSLLKVNIDNTNPLAYGMPRQADVFFSSSPVFRLQPDAAQKGALPVAWFSGSEVLDSGWAWGQSYLDGGTAAVDASVGKGRVFLLGPEVAFRVQSHGTFKLLFNGLYYGSTTDVILGASR